MLKHSAPYSCARLACLCTALWAISLAQADEPQVQPRQAFEASDWHMAEDSVLDSLRGGFEVSTVNAGLAISFGFLRSVTINGELVSQAAFNLPDLSRISVEQAQQVSEALAGLGSTSVVQNSLNNQSIQTLTQIDAGVNSLGLLHSINSQGVLRDALLGAAGLH